MRLPRWAAVLFLPLLVGALLLMHGLDAGGVESGGHGSLGVVSHEHSDEESSAEHHDHSSCPECIAGHVLASCVAVLAAVVVIRAARRFLAIAAAPVTVPVLAGWWDRFAVWRPPDPAWVRLSVMRC